MTCNGITLYDWVFANYPYLSPTPPNYCTINDPLCEFIFTDCYNSQQVIGYTCGCGGITTLNYNVYCNGNSWEIVSSC